MVEKTVGQVLRAKRATLDMTLKQVEDYTKIQKTYIIALEQDDYDALPGDFYIKAYLKQYAERLGLDSDQLIDAYEEGAMIEVDEPIDHSVNYRFIKPSERDDQEQVTNARKTWRYYLPITILGGVACLIVIAISIVVLLNNPKKDDIAENLYTVSASSSVSTKSSQKQEKKSTPESSSAPTPATPKTEIQVTGQGQTLTAKVKHAPNPVKVNLSVAENTEIWLGMTNSDLAGGQVTLTSQTPVVATLSDKTTVLTVGKTSGLMINIGDTPLDLSSIGAPDSPATLTIEIE